jgi:hypothetical protein
MSHNLHITTAPLIKHRQQPHALKQYNSRISTLCGEQIICGGTGIPTHNAYAV